MLSWLTKLLNHGRKPTPKKKAKAERTLHRLQTSCLRQMVEHEQRAEPRRPEYQPI